MMVRLKMNAHEAIRFRSVVIPIFCTARRSCQASERSQGPSVPPALAKDSIAFFGVVDPSQQAPLSICCCANPFKVVNFVGGTTCGVELVRAPVG